MKVIKFGVPLLTLLLTCGCAMTWQPDLENAQKNTPTNASQTALIRAETCFGYADNLESLQQCQDHYLAVLQENPGDYTALTQLSTLNILVGTAYTDGLWAKSERFQQAMRYAELAMYTNEAFKAKVSAGDPLWLAVDALGEAEVEAMFFWVTALQYEFKEGMSLAGKIVNIDWLQHALLVLNHIEAVAPHFGNGGVEFAKLICYYALPNHLGGSKERGDEYMQKAVARSGNWLLPRWARGKYYYVVTGQEDKSVQDLSWVASQKLENYRDPYPWRVHFQENARELLQ